MLGVSALRRDGLGDLPAHTLRGGQRKHQIELPSASFASSSGTGKPEVTRHDVKQCTRTNTFRERASEPEQLHNCTVDMKYGLPGSA